MRGREEQKGGEEPTEGEADELVHECLLLCLLREKSDSEQTRQQ